jgi:hypothetical protein
MALNNNPKIVTDSLTFYMDGANIKSFRGEPTTNLLSTPTINAYPTYGNGWGTYNTNRYCDPVGSYGCAVYWYMGTTISSVSDNIVNTTSSHPFRTYDVLQPQTTGGGLTAATNYLVKKLSSTSFTLHPYNSSQDGSQGYINTVTGNHKVYDDFSNDVRISVNASGFPTMWKGEPHLPNSALVKEIIPGGFNAIDGVTKTDCIRLHYIRDDNVCDGMAYGVDGTVTPGIPHTVSFYTRAVTPSAVGQYVGYQVYNYGSTSPGSYGWGYTLGSLGVWVRVSFTFTPINEYCISYWFGAAGKYKHDIANIQFENKTHMTTFTTSTRGTTIGTGGGWKSLVGGYGGELINGVSYDSSNLGSLVFDGTDDNIITNYNPTTTDILGDVGYSICCWVYLTGNVTGASTAGACIIGNDDAYGIGLQLCTNNYPNFGMRSTGNWDSNYRLELNTWYYVVGEHVAGTNSHIYINGQLVSSYGVATQTVLTSSTNLVIGWSPNRVSGQHFPGRIGSVSVYKKALSSEEILQNFNAHKGRYGL